MAWRKTVKKIKNNHYIYEQRSYRHNGKVKTESRYIGPAGPADQLLYGLKHPYGLYPANLSDDKREVRTEYDGLGKPVGQEVRPPYIPTEKERAFDALLDRIDDAVDEYHGSGGEIDNRFLLSAKMFQESAPTQGEGEKSTRSSEEPHSISENATPQEE